MSSVSGCSELDVVAGREPDLAAARPTNKTMVLAGAIVTVLVTVVFFIPFWNRFLGLRSGDGGFTGGVFFLKGILPYRDYFCAVPPLFVFRSAAVLAIFGKLPIVIRACGVFERVILSLLLYGWLVRFFRVKDATLAALVTIVVSAGDYADPVSSYNHFTILLAVASGLAASYALDEGRTKRALMVLGCLTGVLSELCLDSKQTIGLGVTVAIPLLVGLCLMRLEGVRKATQFLAGFAGGWLVAAGALLGWMAHFGILRVFLRQTFVEGPAAKASSRGDFVVHTFLTLRGYWWAAAIAVGVLAICLGSLGRSEKAESQDTRKNSLQGILLALVIGLGSIFAALLCSWKSIQPIMPQIPAKPMIYASLIGTGVLMAHYTWLFIKRRLSRRQAQFALFASIAFTVAFMTSLSFPAFEAMTVPGLGLIIVVLLNDFCGWWRLAVYSVCGLLLFCQTQDKQGMPFGFERWFEPPVKAATMASSLPELRGFLLPPNTVDFVDFTIRIIRENSTSTDTIFTYPELGFFYGATARMPATFSASHNIDVVSDAFAKQEAERLLRVRPAVLVYAPLPETFVLAEEAYWRNGKRSGQRDLIAAVEALARDYRFVRMFKLYPSGHPVYVFVRP